MHAWDKARRGTLKRVSPDGQTHELERGVNYFVKKLEALGASTEWSCEGHPTGFYIVFSAPYWLAGLIHSCGFFTVEIEGPNRWSIRIHYPQDTQADHKQTLRWATDAWERNLNPVLEKMNEVRTAGTVPAEKQRALHNSQSSVRRHRRKTA